MPFANGLFTPDDFLQIENILYTPIESELQHRTLFSINDSFAPYANEIGYDYYRKQGSAKILAHGGGAKDIPFVGEYGSRATQKVYTIASGIRFTEAERMAMAAKANLGKGPTLNIPATRIATARRYCFETENKLAFAGDADYGIVGVFDDTFYNTSSDLGTKENVAQGATGSTAAEKRLWSNKTAQEILTDLTTAMNAVEADGLFQAKVLALPPTQYNRLRTPFSDYDSRTLLDWLNSNGMYFERIVKAKELKLSNNGDTVDYFMVFDNSPEVVQLAVVRDLQIGDAIYDIIGTSEQAVTLRTGGIIVRHPAAFYVGKGI